MKHYLNLGLLIGSLLAFDVYAIKPELKIAEKRTSSISMAYQNGEVVTPDFHMLKNWTWYFMYDKGRVFAVNVEKSAQRFYQLNWSDSPSFAKADSSIFKSLKWDIYTSLHANWDAKAKAREALESDALLQEAKFGEVIDGHCGKIEFFLQKPPADDKYYLTSTIKLHQGIITLQSDEMIEHIGCTADQSITLGVFYGPGSKGNISQGVVHFPAKPQG